MIHTENREGYTFAYSLAPFHSGYVSGFAGFTDYHPSSGSRPTAIRTIMTLVVVVGGGGGVNIHAEWRKGQTVCSLWAVTVGTIGRVCALP